MTDSLGVESPYVTRLREWIDDAWKGVVLSTEWISVENG